MLDFDQLVSDRIISSTTKEWLEPLWQDEQREAQHVREEAAQRLFFGTGERGSDDDDMVEEATIMLHGIEIPYLCDEQSAGHGNRVWHASIATCLYLYKMLEELLPTETSSNNTFQSLELGGGTAIPSLFLSHLLSVQSYSCSKRPLVHVTDGEQYRNIRQILESIERQQPSSLRESVQFRVSPHNWGEGLEEKHDDRPSFIHDECPTKSRNQYHLVIVSDCIYNPMYHAALLESIAVTLQFPSYGDDLSSSGGRAIISFSLHGNTSDETVWNFLDKAACKHSQDQKWKLQVQPVTELCEKEEHGAVLKSVGQGGWHMEDKMKELDIWVAHLEPRRWIAYLYEITWIPSNPG